MPTTEFHRTGFVEANGARLAYRVSGEGPPLLLLHAGITDSRMWHLQHQVFGRHYRVISYDLRGFGQSVALDEPFSHHRDVYELLNHLNLDQTHILGVSMGGATAIDFALNYPAMVDHLILVAPGLEGYQVTDQATRALWQAAEEAFERGNLEQAADIEIQMWVAGPNRTLNQVAPAVRSLLREMLILSYTKTDLSQEESLQPPAIERLAEIQRPTMVLVGDQDRPPIMEIVDILATRIGRARKVVLPNVAHLPNLEQPDRFNQLVLDFLAGNEL